MIKKISFLSIILTFLIIITACQPIKEMPTAKIKNQEIKLLVASSLAEKIKGLSGSTSLPVNQGMLFPYQDYKIRSFWMKNMNFPIDIVWIKDDVIIGFAKNVPPPTGNQTDNQLPRYLSNEPVNFVLELNAGWLDQNQVLVGDRVDFFNLE
ncbi:MAG: DUF192 domain-containing protein [Candidatus Buchananbacteria bacterium]|nr:DUF192 domain-containing protein [Candidatus Buchananbacteria bacterium]